MSIRRDQVRRPCLANFTPIGCRRRVEIRRARHPAGECGRRSRAYAGAVVEAAGEGCPCAQRFRSRNSAAVFVGGEQFGFTHLRLTMLAGA
jgi:hypothetical protein